MNMKDRAQKNVSAGPSTCFPAPVRKSHASFDGARTPRETSTRIPSIAPLLCAVVLAAGCSDESARSTHLPSSASTASSADAVIAPASAEPTQSSKHEPAPDEATRASPSNAHAEPPTSAAALKYLPVEQRFLSQNALSIEDVAPALKSNNFDQLVNALQREASRDPDAQEITQLYRSEAEKLGVADVRLVNMACGLSVCMGSIRAPSEAALSRWSEKFGNSKRTPSFSEISYTTQIAPHEFESRFMFSTDPGANALSGRIPPGK